MEKGYWNRGNQEKASLAQLSLSERSLGVSKNPHQCYKQMKILSRFMYLNIDGVWIGEWVY
jgi:hypothetical protein